MRSLLALVVVVAVACVSCAEDAKPFPKPLKDGEKVDTGGWFGKTVLPKRHSDSVRIGNWEDGKQVTWKPKNLMNCTVREDRDGFLRVHDGRWEGWVSKDDMLTAEDAPIFFDKAVKANLKDANAWYMRGSAWDSKGEYDSAIEDFTEAIRLKPDASWNYTARGIAWDNKKEYRKAIADYTEAIRLNPDDVAAYNGRGTAWAVKQDYDKAIADLTQVVKLDPKCVDAVFNRGNVWYCKKEYDKAIADYTEALKLDPKYGRGYNGRGSVRYCRKEFDKAVADYTEALKLDPKDVYAIASMAEALGKLKKPSEAVKHFRKALNLEPMDWIHRDFAFFLSTCPDAEYRDGKKAVELAKKAVEKVGKDADWKFFATLAAAHAEAGDFELAVVEQRKALDDKSLDKDDRAKMEKRLELYRAKKPYRDEE